MAEAKDVQQYLAYWFQAGKRIMLKGGREAYRPSTVIQGDRYSDEFQKCWNDVLSENSGDCFLEGTDQTIRELLSPSWDVASCARCEMPVPMVSVGVSPLACPCHDVPTWPNEEIPRPRSPVDSRDRLSQLRSRLNQPDSDHTSISQDKSGSQNKSGTGAIAP
ncbi:MAG: hypothetical protein WBA57_09195 [Elainellaceae cyanobacterium]